MRRLESTVRDIENSLKTVERFIRVLSEHLVVSGDAEPEFLTSIFLRLGASPNERASAVKEVEERRLEFGRAKDAAEAAAARRNGC